MTEQKHEQTEVVRDRSGSTDRQLESWMAEEGKNISPRHSYGPIIGIAIGIAVIVIAIVAVLMYKMGNRVDSLTEQTENLSSDVSHNLKSIGGRLVAIEDAQALQSATLQEHAKNIGEIGRRMQGYDSAQAALQRRIARAEINASAAIASVKEINNAFPGGFAELASLPRLVREMRGSLDSIAPNFVTVESRLAALENNLTSPVVISAPDDVVLRQAVRLEVATAVSREIGWVSRSLSNMSSQVGLLHSDLTMMIGSSAELRQAFLRINGNPWSGDTEQSGVPQLHLGLPGVGRDETPPIPLPLERIPKH